MGLYGDVDRVLADLRAAGFADDAPLTVADLSPFDQYHYHGTAAVDVAAQALASGPNDVVLDVGSGLGGPARYLADRTGAEVVALELQPDLHALAASLTDRCGLGSQVRHLCGDIVQPEAGELSGTRFAAMMSLLCILHIPDRARLFGSCASLLEPGAPIYVEDFYERSMLSDAERDLLAAEVSCPYLPDLDAYVAQLAAAGFVDIDIVDMSDDWSAFVHDRYLAFRKARGELKARYNEGTVAALDRFYGAVDRLFAGGNLGGARITAKRSTV